MARWAEPTLTAWTRFFGVAGLGFLRFRGFTRVKRTLSILAIVLALGCGSKTPPEDAIAAQKKAEEAEALKEHAKRQEHELRMVKSQLALAQSEAHDLRDEANRPRRPQTIRISESESDYVAYSPPPRRRVDSGPRPVLRLYGSGGNVPIEQLEVMAGRVPGLPGDDQPARADDLPAGFRGSGTAIEVYQRGLRLIRDEQFEQALAVFAEFGKRHGEHPYADNALFWRGEIRYLRQEYPQAIEAFELVQREHPTGNKVPDALYKIGLIHLKQGDEQRARRYFEEVRKRFPNTAAARLASRENPS